MRSVYGPYSGESSAFFTATTNPERQMEAASLSMGADKQVAASKASLQSLQARF